jgi:sporulation protein YlmC with PRC-barrel domain
MPVIDFRDGAKVGKVGNLLFDPQDLRVRALLVKRSIGEAIVKYDDVLKIGRDVVVIHGMSSADEAGSSSQGRAVGSAVLERLRKIDKLVGAAVAGSDGTYRGDVSDVDIDPATGNVTTLSVRRGGVLGIGADETRFQRASICGVGDKIVTVQVLQ